MSGSTLSAEASEVSEISINENNKHREKAIEVKVKGGQTGDEESLAAEESGLFNSSDDAIITEQHPGCHTLPRLLNMTLSQSFSFSSLRTYSIFSFHSLF